MTSSASLRTFVFLTLGFVASTAAFADQAVELGRVDWGRSYEEATSRAAASGRPMFVLFQEVPGCATCVNFGQAVLSHPLLVEAIETEFVPVAIHNNPGSGEQGRADRRALATFREPSWNNPVVRFVDASGRDLIPRRDRVWQREAIARRMVKSLEAAGRPVPPYLQLLAEEGTRANADEATLAMGCFWHGEACLADVPGVVATRPGWSGGREVVVVEFDSSRLDADELLAEARRRGCADRVLLDDRPRSAKVSDEKYYLRRSKLASLDLTPLQALRVNAALANGRDPLVWLSPRQRARAQAN